MIRPSIHIHSLRKFWLFFSRTTLACSRQTQSNISADSSTTTRQVELSRYLKHEEEKTRSFVENVITQSCFTRPRLATSFTGRHESFLPLPRATTHIFVPLFVSPRVKRDRTSFVALILDRQLMDDCGVMSALTATGNGKERFDSFAETCFHQAGFPLSHY